MVCQGQLPRLCSLHDEAPMVLLLDIITLLLGLGIVILWKSASGTSSKCQHLAVDRLGTYLST